MTAMVTGELPDYAQTRRHRRHHHRKVMWIHPWFAVHLFRLLAFLTVIYSSVSSISSKLIVDEIQPCNLLWKQWKVLASFTVYWPHYILLNFTVLWQFRLIRGITQNPSRDYIFEPWQKFNPWPNPMMTSMTTGLCVRWRFGVAATR